MKLGQVAAGRVPQLSCPDPGSSHSYCPRAPHPPQRRIFRARAI